MTRSSVFWGLILSPVLFIAACQPQARKIEYGADMCHYCKMTVVDAQHAAQLVSTKGKTFIFDAIECMVAFQKASPEMEFALELVNDYQSPGTLVQADRSSYLISENLPSPMGAYLTAFADKTMAQKMKESKGGTLYHWEDLPAVLP